MRSRVAPLFPLIIAVAVSGGQRAELRVFRIVAEFDRLARRPLWPGFEPRKIALEFFDGGRTWLLRHPHPPPEFAPVAGHADLRMFEARHESVRANTSILLAGVPVATGALEGRSEEPDELAALLLHEAFHVFQGRRHPKWGANEADLLLYPFDDSEALALRRLESEALGRALGEPRRREASAWAARAVKLRERRFGRLPASAAAYERGTEMKEGLARYIETAAIGVRSSLFPAEEFSPDAIRERGYASGCAIAILLDRLDPTWKMRLEKNDEDSPLDELLARAVAETRPTDRAPVEEEQARQDAARDIRNLLEHRAALRREFLDAPGWRIVVDASRPLFPQGFDPLNLQRLTVLEVLHTRWLKLSSEAGSLEVLDRRCLTEGAGEHPLFQGVRRVTITGLSAEPQIEIAQGALKLVAEGVTLEMRGVELTRSDRSVTIKVP